MLVVPDRCLKLITCAWLILLLLGLQGCSALKPRANLIKATNIHALTQWQATGKIAIIDEQKKQSANFNWLQDNDKYNTSFSTFLGINVLSIKRDNDGLFIAVDGNSYQDDNPERLVYELTGWWLPVDQLSHWLKADIAPHEGAIIRDELGHIQQFIPHCTAMLCTTQYLIKYGAYRPIEQLQLPHSVIIQASGLTQQTLKIKIQQWR